MFFAPQLKNNPEWASLASNLLLTSNQGNIHSCVANLTAEVGLLYPEEYTYCQPSILVSGCLLLLLPLRQIGISVTVSAAIIKINVPTGVTR